MKFIQLSNIEFLKSSIEKFFIDNKYAYAFFSPHEYSYDALLKEIASKPKDYFVFLMDDNNIAGYGLLRGWSEGYDIPSLGIMIDINYQGKKLSETLMNHLHQICVDRNAKKIRLRVYRKNYKAISLYNKLGYVLSDFDENTFIGFKTL